MEAISSSKKRKISRSSLAVGPDLRFAWDGSDGVTIDDWLELVRPSLLSSNDCAWIHVENVESKCSTRKKDNNNPPCFSGDEYQPALDKISQMIEGGCKRISSSVKKECVQSLIATAIEQQCTVGKWMLFIPPSEVDETWKKIARATASGKLGSCSAKIAPAMDKEKGDDGEYENVVCCIYVEDFTRRRNVQNVLKALIDLGFKVTSGFKPDFYTYLGIYTGNEWRLPPCLFSVKEALSWEEFSDDDDNDDDKDNEKV